MNEILFLRQKATVLISGWLLAVINVHKADVSRHATHPLAHLFADLGLL